MLSSCFPRFVDRDMFMRFRGGGVGHRATHEHTKPMSQEAGTETVPDENEDNFEGDESFGNGEQSEEDEANSESSIGEGDYDETVGELEDEFEGEDGEEPWGIDEYSAEGYSAP